jgi:hypothetical protein
MRLPWPVPAGLATALLAGCADPSPPPPLPQRAAICDVDLSHINGWGGAWRLRMSNEGGSCFMLASRDGGQIIGTGIAEPPAHGEAQSILLSLNLIRITYRPNPGFTGTDRFRVSMGPLLAWVEATVVPPPAQVPLAAGPANR